MEYLYVFLIGGAFCVIGQLLIDKTKLLPPQILVIFVVAGVLLTAFGLYEPLVDFGKSGATVPLPGFGHNLAKGAIEGARTEGFMGALTGGIKSTAAGISAAIVFGYLVAIIFSPKSKR